MESDSSFSGIRLEVGREVTQSQVHNFLLFITQRVDLTR
jgi:hypothetical protein